MADISLGLRCLINLIVLLLLIVNLFLTLSQQPLSQTDKKLKPLLIKPGGSKDIKDFVTPDFLGENSLSQILIACPDSTINVSGKSYVTARINSGSTFDIDGQLYNYADLSCSSQPKPEGRKTETTCGSYDQYQVIDVGFPIGSDFYNLMYSCFDERTYRSVYNHSKILPDIKKKQKGFDRPHWMDGGFFGNINVDKQYRRATQINTVSTLLRSRDLGSQYISEKNEYFLSKGHLVAKSDFILGAQEYATFLYVNATPQWQTLNGGNWSIMEQDLRKYAANNYVELDVYTGTHGIMTLPDVNGVETELYMYIDDSDRKYIPVPKIIWKIAHNASSKAAVVLVGVNNPYIAYSNSDYFLCKDLSSEVSWLSWNPMDQKKGYCYCCEYSDFKEIVVDVPSLTVESLLM